MIVVAVAPMVVPPQVVVVISGTEAKHIRWPPAAGIITITSVWPKPWRAPVGPVGIATSA